MCPPLVTILFKSLFSGFQDFTFKRKLNDLIFVQPWKMVFSKMDLRWKIVEIISHLFPMLTSTRFLQKISWNFLSKMTEMVNLLFHMWFSHFRSKIFRRLKLKGIGAFWNICIFSIFFLLMVNFLPLRNFRIKTFSNVSCHFWAYFV